MSFVAGLLRGFNQRTKEARDQARLDQDRQDAREDKILSVLAQSDDAEVSHSAVLASLEKATGAKAPKGGFLASLMGPRTAAHPAVEQLLKLANSPTQKEVPGLAVSDLSFESAGTTAAPKPPASAPAPTGPPPAVSASPQTVGTPPPATAAPGSAAMPPVPTPGSMPGGAALPSPGAPPPPPAGGPGEKTAPFPSPVLAMSTPVFKSSGQKLPGTSVSVPRKIFLSTTEKALEGARARAQGDVEGEVAGLIAAGFQDTEARQLIKDKYARAARGGVASAPFQAMALEIPGPNGTWTQTQGTFNRVTGDYEDLQGNLLTNARPRQTTGSTSMGTDREALARAYFGKPFVLLDQIQQRNVLNLEMSFVQNEAFRRGTGTGQASINTQLASPIGISAGADQNTDPTRTLGSMGGQAIGRPLPDAEVSQLSEYQNAIDITTDLAAALTKGSGGVTPGTGALSWLASKAPNFLTEFTGWGADEKSRNAVIALAKQIIGKSFEDGVLRKEDEIKYKDILPLISDPPQVAAGKILLLQRRVKAQLDTKRSELGAAGYRVGTPPPAVGAGETRIEYEIVNGQLVRKGGGEE